MVQSQRIHRGGLKETAPWVDLVHATTPVVGTPASPTAKHKTCSRFRRSLQRLFARIPLVEWIADVTPPVRVVADITAMAAVGFLVSAPASIATLCAFVSSLV